MRGCEYRVPRAAAFGGSIATVRAEAIYVFDLQRNTGFNSDGSMGANVLCGNTVVDLAKIGDKLRVQTNHGNEIPVDAE